MGNSGDAEEPMDIDDAVDQKKEETESPSLNENGMSKKATKRRKQRKLKFSHKKRRTSPPATCMSSLILDKMFFRLLEAQECLC